VQLRRSQSALRVGLAGMVTVVPDLCGTVIMVGIFTANTSSVAGFDAALLATIMSVGGTSTKAAVVGTDKSRGCHRAAG
jgi:hypothetical protein